MLNQTYFIAASVAIAGLWVNDKSAQHADLFNGRPLFYLNDNDYHLV